MARSHSSLDSLRSLVGERSLRCDPESLVNYGRDWTRVYDAQPLGSGAARILWRRCRRLCAWRR